MSSNSPLDDLAGCFGCAFVIAIVFGVVVGIPMTIFDDGAEPPPPPPAPAPATDDIRLWITGDDGGTYEGRYVFWTPKGESYATYYFDGTIQSGGEWWPIELEGFKSDGDKEGVGSADLEFNVAKTGAWQGTVDMVLEVNGKAVECDTLANSTIDKTADVWFDLDNPEDFGSDYGCGFKLGIS